MGNFMDITEKKFVRSILASMVLMTGLGGCSTPNSSMLPSFETNQQASASSSGEVDLIRVGYSIADALIAELRKGHPGFDQEVPILVASFVNRSDLNSSSEMGLLMADHVSSRMTQHGYTVIEPKLRQDLSIRQQEGEFILSRDIERISQENGAYAVVVGSYTTMPNLIDFTAKIVAILDRKSLASVDARLPMAGNFHDLLLTTNRGTDMGVVSR